MRGDSQSAGAGPPRRRGDLGSDWWAGLAARPAASHVDKRTGEEGSSCLVASQLPSLAELLGELGRVPSEGKGLGPKFRRTVFFSFIFLKQHFLDSSKIYIDKYFPRVPSSGNLEAGAQLRSK